LRMLASSSMMRMFMRGECPALRLYASRTSSTDAADGFKGSGEYWWRVGVIFLAAAVAVYPKPVFV
jgi:hypothetical protein